MNNSDKTYPRLIQTEEGLALTDGLTTLRSDFGQMIARLAPNKIAKELVVCAAKGKQSIAYPGQLWAIDATAGLGEDGLLLAAAGYRVTMYERNKTVAAMLSDALDKARNAKEYPWLCDAASRIEVRCEDSIVAMKELDASPDVIMLDPMFPERQKSAEVKKKFQMLHKIMGPCDDEEALLESTMAARPKKIVIKRTLKGPFLADVKPTYSIKGKAIRYDCIVL
ncbi:MAG: class I SAM-dependent methyltransferase [Eggerthellaceae bacterium]|nr:class I SAM-dependent methyltransferase [Eggerthellaceae bacterium]